MRSRRIILACIGLLGLGMSLPAQAYPTMIRYGYKNCVACHQSPNGGGLLTPYGRGIAGSASLIQSDYQPPSNSLYQTVTLNGRADHGLQARLMMITKEEDTSVFPMQLDYLGSYQLAKPLYFDLTVGYFPERAQKKDDSIAKQNPTAFKNLVLRKALLKFRENEDYQIVAGRDFIPAGLNLDDHTSFVRSRNRKDTTDFVTQVRYDYIGEDAQFSPFIYAPSFQEDKLNREYGFGIRGEQALGANTSVGAFTTFGKSTLIERGIAGVFARVSAEKVGVLGEYSLTSRNLTEDGPTRFAQHAAYLRPFYAPTEYIELGWVNEYLLVRNPFYEHAVRTGPNAYFRISRNLTLIGNLRQELQPDFTETELFFQLFGHME